MREIKYRAWDISVNKFIRNIDGITLDGNILDIVYGEHGPCLNCRDIILTQYTGLKDKNGVEIYEGYILEGKFDIEKVDDFIYLGLSESEKKTGTKIFYVEDIFYLYTHPIPDDISVIGNIYENPNLLKLLNE